MGIASTMDDEKVVVCGPRTGIAGLVAARLADAGGLREVRLADETSTLPEQACVYVCACARVVLSEELPAKGGWECAWINFGALVVFTWQGYRGPSTCDVWDAFVVGIVAGVYNTPCYNSSFDRFRLIYALDRNLWPSCASCHRVCYRRPT